MTFSDRFVVGSGFDAPGSALPLPFPADGFIRPLAPGGPFFVVTFGGGDTVTIISSPAAGLSDSFPEDDSMTICSWSGFAFFFFFVATDDAFDEEPATERLPARVVRAVALFAGTTVFAGVVGS